MASANSFQLSQAAAEKYEAHSVPAMFEPLARATLEKLTLPENGRILDVACGTGALTRVIAANLPGQGQISGTDLNQTMIDVARQKQPSSSHQVDWQAADVCSLPYGDAQFDFGFVQQGLQFFPDKAAALREIRRVLKPDGQLVLTCWRAISPFNSAVSQALARHVSEAAAEKARAPFSFRDGDLIASLLQQAGFFIHTHEAIILQRRLADLEAQIMALPFEKDLREKGDAVLAQVVCDVARSLQPYDQDGVFIVPQEAHFFVASGRR